MPTSGLGWDAGEVKMEENLNIEIFLTNSQILQTFALGLNGFQQSSCLSIV
jgi:hypothetical protein